MAGRKLGAWSSRQRRLSIIWAPGAAGFRVGSGERPFLTTQAPSSLLAAQLAAESETERTAASGPAGTDDGPPVDAAGARAPASSALSCLANSSCHARLEDGLEHHAECAASGESALSFFCGDQL